MTIEKLRENLDLIELNGKKIYLVGTAHVSESSAKLVEDVIREFKPKAVAVELCDSRFQSLKDPERWKNTDIVSVIKSGKIYVLMAQLILASFQKKIGKQLNIRPGAEMMKAIEVAKEENSEIILADRDVKVTLKRVWHSVGFIGGAKLLSALVFSLFSNEKISNEEIERLKSKDILASILDEIGEKLPKLRISLIDERDRYLAEKIQASNAETIVAVVGAGHVAGMKSYFGTKIDLAELEVIPEKGKIGKILSWSMPALIVVAIIWGFFGSGIGTSLQMLEAWFWITGFMGALGAAVALAHPLTILAAFLGTPIATLHPLIASGWIAGLVEAWLRKPRVSDFENFSDAVSSVKGIWTNRVSRIILIIITTNVFAMLGMVWGAKVLASFVISR